MEMRYDSDGQAVINYLVERLRRELTAGKRVTLLLSGGSNIAMQAAVFDRLRDLDLRHLRVSLIDERYGPVGHADENWQQLLASGTMLGQAETYRVLRGESRAVTAQQFGAQLEHWITSADVSIAVLGVGADSHILGVKPSSPVLDDQSWAAEYRADDYERVTMTPRALAAVDEVVVSARGAPKAEALQRLNDQERDPAHYPIQALHDARKVIIFSDTYQPKGEKE